MVENTNIIAHNLGPGMSLNKPTRDEPNKMCHTPNHFTSMITCNPSHNRYKQYSNHCQLQLHSLRKAASFGGKWTAGEKG